MLAGALVPAVVGIIPGCIPTLGSCTQPISRPHKDRMGVPSPAAATSDRGEHPEQGLQLQTLGCAAPGPSSPPSDDAAVPQARLSIAQSRAELTLLRASKERRDN